MTPNEALTSLMQLMAMGGPSGRHPVPPQFPDKGVRRAPVQTMIEDTSKTIAHLRGCGVPLDQAFDTMMLHLAGLHDGVRAVTQWQGGARDPESVKEGFMTALTSVATVGDGGDRHQLLYLPVVLPSEDPAAAAEILLFIVDLQPERTEVYMFSVVSRLIQDLG